jgi:protein-S-isoprenylcysteine O-methyltransferase Ste14
LILTGKIGFPGTAGVTWKRVSTASNALKTAVFTLFAPVIVAGVIPQRFVYENHVALARGVVPRLLGGILVGLGVVGYFWCATLFVRAEGTPAPAMPTKRTVVSGLYRINRNPMYTSVLAVVFGQALLYEYPTLLLYGAFLAVGFHLFVLFYEERALRAQFNGEYEKFCRQVPRWIPRLRR